MAVAEKDRMGLEFAPLSQGKGIDLWVIKHRLGLVSVGAKAAGLKNGDSSKAGTEQTAAVAEDNAVTVAVEADDGMGVHFVGEMNGVVHFADAGGIG